MRMTDIFGLQILYLVATDKNFTVPKFSYVMTAIKIGYYAGTINHHF